MICICEKKYKLQLKKYRPINFMIQEQRGVPMRGTKNGSMDICFVAVSHTASAKAHNSCKELEVAGLKMDMNVDKALTQKREERAWVDERFRTFSFGASGGISAA
jgi:hypothetical protein